MSAARKWTVRPSSWTYAIAERRRVDIHEAEHATVAHSDAEERSTRASNVHEVLMQIVMGGNAAGALWFSLVSSVLAGDFVSTKVAACMAGKVLDGPQIRSEAALLLKDANAKALAVHDEHREAVEALAAAPVDRGEPLGNELIKVIQCAAPASERKAADSPLRAVLPADAHPATTHAASWRASGPLPAPPGRCPGGAGIGPGSGGRQPVTVYEVPETVNAQLAVLSVAVRPGRR